MRSRHYLFPKSRIEHRAQPRAAFTLIEIMVSLAIFSVLLAIIFIPLTQGVRFSQIGTARADTQQAAQTTMNRIVSELRRAVHVFPNERMAGITDRAPYSNGTLGYPYFQGDSGTVCSGTLQGAENTSRLDFILPRSSETDTETDRRKSGYSLVTFYARRLNNLKNWNEPINTYGEDNPIGLFRARIPTLRGNGSTFPSDTTPNALTNGSRYPSSTECSTNGAAINSGTRWLIQNNAGEPQLNWVTDGVADDNITDPITTTGTIPASNALITPQNVGLYAPQALIDNVTDLTKPMRNYQPETSFICEDSNGNGIIDRVTVTLVLAKFDSAGAQNSPQTVRLTQTVDLPNTESRFSVPAP